MYRRIRVDKISFTYSQFKQAKTGGQFIPATLPYLLILQTKEILYS